MVAPLRQFRPFLKKQEEKVGNIQGKRAQSLPEWRVAVALYKFNVPFNYQVSRLGGRLFRGGQIIDFEILTRPISEYLEIDGEYWHGSASQKEEDKFLRAILKAEGRRIRVLRGSQLDSQQMADDQIRRLYGGRF